MRCDMQAYLSFHWPGISVMVIVTSTWAHNCDTYTYQIEYVIDLNILLKTFQFYMYSFVEICLRMFCVCVTNYTNICLN